MEMDMEIIKPSGGNRDVGLKNFASFLHHLDLQQEFDGDDRGKGKIASMSSCCFEKRSRNELGRQALYVHNLFFVVQKSRIHLGIVT
jgi:hypothetical protein